MRSRGIGRVPAGVACAGCLALLLLAAGCGRDAHGPARRHLLFAPDHAPDVLTEARALALPPDTGGNRFLSGWWPWRHGGPGGTVVLNPLAGARIEVVHLADRPRTLVLDLLDGARPRRGTVVVRHAGCVVARAPVADPVEVRLPAGLPRGRVALDLAFELPAGDDPPGVVAGGVRPAMAAGEVRQEGADLVQAGESLVEVVVPVEAGMVLRGRFEPPAAPLEGQRFELTVGNGRGELQKRFRWEGRWLDRVRGERAFAVALAGGSRFLRVRLAAQGQGPPGRWRGLVLETPSRPSSSPPRSLSTAGEEMLDAQPPRLVVVYVMDALRADAVGHLGGRAGVSPVVDRLAREGLTFRRHRSLAPNTLPSTKSLFVGRVYRTRGGWTLAPDEGATLAEQFRRAGYRTGLFSGNVHVSRAFGMDRGFEHVAEEVLVDGAAEHGGAAPAPARRAAYNDNAEAVHTAALAWLRGLPPGERAFLYLHTIHPHNPYDPPEPLRSRFAPPGGGSAIAGHTATLLAVQHGRRPVDEADRRRLAGLYAGAFAYNDRELGRFLAGAAAFAPPRATFLAVTSDHGEELFDHGGVLHGYTLHEEMLRIPLVLWAPGRVAPGAVDRPTSTLDLRRCLLALLGAAAAEGGAPDDAPAPTAAPWHHLAAASSLEGGIFSAQTARWKVVLAPRRGIGWGQGEGIGRTRDAEVLFDLARDPGETENRAGAGDLEAAWLRQRLRAWIAEGDGPAAGTPPPLDDETRRRLGALGYAR